MKEINRHPSIGAKILKPLDFLGPAVDYVSAHHERLMDALSQGLKDNEIPLGPRSNPLPTFTTPSLQSVPTKNKNVAEALAILRDIAGTRIRTDIVETLERVLAKSGAPDAQAPRLAAPIRVPWGRSGSGPCLLILFPGYNCVDRGEKHSKRRGVTMKTCSWGSVEKKEGADGSR